MGKKKKKKKKKKKNVQIELNRYDETCMRARENHFRTRVLHILYQRVKRENNISTLSNYWATFYNFQLFSTSKQALTDSCWDHKYRIYKYPRNCAYPSSILLHLLLYLCCLVVFFFFFYILIYLLFSWKSLYAFKENIYPWVTVPPFCKRRQYLRICSSPTPPPPPPPPLDLKPFKIGTTVNPPYTDTRYNDKIRYNNNLNVTKSSLKTWQFC